MKIYIGRDDAFQLLNITGNLQAPYLFFFKRNPIFVLITTKLIPPPQYKPTHTSIFVVSRVLKVEEISKIPTW